MTERLIAYCSDLHLDSGAVNGPFDWMHTVTLFDNNLNIDTLIVAGDCVNHHTDAVTIYNRLADRFRLVIAVLGNHECSYGGLPVNANIKGNVKVLDNMDGIFVDDDTAYIGSCLDPSDNDSELVSHTMSCWNDPSINKVVIVTHHIPTQDNIYGNLEFVPSACGTLLNKLGAPPKQTFVVFGHTHYPLKKIHDGYMLLNNPRGYRGKRRDGTDWAGLELI